MDKNLKQAIYGTITQQLKDMRDEHLITFDNTGHLRFTNKFFKELQEQGYSKNSLIKNETRDVAKDDEIKPIKANESNKIHKVGKYTFSEPSSVQKLKMLYREDFTNAKTAYSQATSIGSIIYSHFIKSLFGKDRPCDHIIDKKDSRMRVSAKSKKGTEAFTMALIRPTVDYKTLWIATAKAYSLEIGITTCTLTTFFAEDRWESYYDEIEETLSDGRDNEIDEMFGKRISNDGSSTSDIG